MTIANDALDTMPEEDLSVVAPGVRDGDILLCAAHDPFSRLIGWSTKSPWTHVAIAWRWPPLNRIVAFECVQHIGVHAVGLERFISQTSSGSHPYPGKIALARHAAMPRGDALKPMADFAVDAMGDRFSPGEILKIATRIAVGRLHRRMPRALGAKDEFICSEFVDRCFRAVGVEIPWDGRGFIAPADIALDPKVEAVAQIRTR
ncbi:MAG: hypothetical protein ABI376_00670 [Caulobacteraceae bacterium]